MDTKFVHWVEDYTTGDQDVTTVCDKKISTWAEAPEERAVGAYPKEIEVTCPLCTTYLVKKLRDEATRQAERVSSSLSHTLETKKRIAQLEIEHAVLLSALHEVRQSYQDVTPSSLPDTVFTALASVTSTRTSEMLDIARAFYAHVDDCGTCEAGRTRSLHLLCSEGDGLWIEVERALSILVRR